MTEMVQSYHRQQGHRYNFAALGVVNIHLNMDKIDYLEKEIQKNWVGGGDILSTWVYLVEDWGRKWRLTKKNCRRELKVRGRRGYRWSCRSSHFEAAPPSTAWFLSRESWDYPISKRKVKQDWSSRPHTSSPVVISQTRLHSNLQRRNRNHPLHSHHHCKAKGVLLCGSTLWRPLPSCCCCIPGKDEQSLWACVMLSEVASTE